MRRLNPAHARAVIRIINQAPFFKLLSMSMKNVVLGGSRLELRVGEKHHNPFAGVHGGVFCSVIDTAAYWAAYGHLDEDLGLLTLDVTVNLLGPADDERLIVKGRCIKPGRTIILAEATAETPGGRLVCQGQSKLIARPEGPSVRRYLEQWAGGILPPKYLVSAGEIA